MKRIAIALCAVALLAATGCPPPQQRLGGPYGHVASSRGLEVELVVPKYTFYRGEKLPLVVVVRNTSADDILIRADSGALVQVTLWRRAAGAWEQVKRYPESALVVAKRWRLPAGETRRFPMNLEVAPEWPTNEPLRLVGEVNGRPDVRPTAMIDVYPTGQDYDKATKDQRE